MFIIVFFTKKIFYKKKLTPYFNTKKRFYNLIKYTVLIYQLEITFFVFFI